MMGLFKYSSFWRGVSAALLAMAASPREVTAGSSSVRESPSTLRGEGVVWGRTFDVAKYGATGDGKTICTEAIQKAINEATKVGGGRVFIPEGTFLTGALFVKSNVDLHLGDGAVLQAVLDESAYPDVWTRVAGIEMKWPAAVINVYEQPNVKITGKGVLDGNGRFWWRKYWGDDGRGGMRRDYEARGLRWAVDYDCKRVRALAIYNSQDVEVRDVTIKRSGFWSLTSTYSERVTIDGVIIQANDGSVQGPSSDGIDIDSSRDVVIRNCDIDCNDDNICLKAGRDADGLRVNRPTENVVISNCVTRAGHGMVTLGSETSGGIRNVVISNIKAFGTTSGVRFKSARIRGGVVENIRIDGLTLERVDKPFDFELDWNPSYSYPTIPDDVDRAAMPVHWKVLTQQVTPPERGIPEFRSISIANVTASGAAQAFHVNAHAEKPVADVEFRNVRVQARRAGEICNAVRWRMQNVVLETADGLELKLRKCAEVEAPKVIKPILKEAATSNRAVPEQ